MEDFGRRVGSAPAQRGEAGFAPKALRISMTEKRNKYDTDPLDPDFVRRTEKIGGTPTADTMQPPAGSQEPAPQAAEDATRRFDGPPPGERFPSSYPSIFVPPVYQPPAAPRSANFGATNQPPHAAPSQYGFHANSRPTSRPVQKLGVAENWATMMPYAPFYIGMIVSLVELVLVPRTETRTRFHAAQGLALHVVILIASILLGIVEIVADTGLGGKILSLAAFVFLIVSMCRVWQGKPHHIAPLDDLTKKINERFEPRK